MESYIKQGDCFALMKELDNASIDAIIVDPPYRINQASWDKNFDYQAAITECKRLLKENGNFIIFQGWSNVAMTIDIAKNCGFILQDWIIYDRIKGRGAKRHLISTREDILWFTKSKEYTFNKIPSNIIKKTGGFGLKNNCKYRALSNVWTDISPIVPWSKEKTPHPTQKPITLLERCVSIWTNPGDIVLDYCMGSGTTCLAAKNLGRKYIGFELNEKYFEIAKMRIADVADK